MLPLACLDGDLKSGASVADLILIMGLRDIDSSTFTLDHQVFRKFVQINKSLIIEL